VSRLVWGLTVWTVAFFALELPAHWGLVPWPTFSRTVWIGEADWQPVSLIVEALMVVLLVHFVFRITAAALIATALLGGFAIVIHILTR
jgi:hypothetical protein